MKLLNGLAIAFCLLAITACSNSNTTTNNVVRRPVQVPGDFPNLDNQIYGAWVSSEPVSQQGNVGVWFLLYFNQSNIVAASAQCSFSDRDLIATTRVTANITGGTVALLQAGQDSENGPNNENCNVNIKAGSFSYQVAGDSLQLVDLATNQVMMFSRMR